MAQGSKLALCHLFGLQVFKIFLLAANLKIKIFYIKISGFTIFLTLELHSNFIAVSYNLMTAPNFGQGSMLCHNPHHTLSRPVAIINLMCNYFSCHQEPS